jgi:hypothetical protein
MKNKKQLFILKTILLLTPFLVFMSYLEYDIRKEPTAMGYKKAAFEKQIKTLEVIILGTSHTFNGINPDKFSYSGFNLAESSQPIYYDYHILMRYMNELPKLKLVIINISNFSIRQNYLNDVKYISRQREYYYVWKIGNDNVKWFYPEVCSRLLEKGTYLALQSFFNKTPIDIKYFPQKNGWLRMDTTYAHLMSDSATKSRIEGFNKVMTTDSMTINKNIRLLDNLIAELQLRKIIPVFITAPLSPIFIRNERADFNDFNEKQIALLCQKYAIDYFNYSKDTRFENKDFRDPDHLNKTGANKFSTIIDKEILIKYLPK